MLGMAGKVDFTVMHLSSSTTSFPSTWDFNSNQQCIGGSGSHQVLFPLTNFYILGWLYNFENPFFMFFLDQLYNIVFHIACTVKLSFSCSFWCIFFSCFLPLLTVLCIYCKRFFGENMDYARYLSRICCCSCYHCRIRTVRGKLILKTLKISRYSSYT